MKNAEGNLSTYNSAAAVDTYGKAKGLTSNEEKSFEKYLKEGNNILDVGCGAGRTTVFLNKIGPTTGVDYSDALIAQARKLHPDITFKVMDAMNLNYPGGSFDAVVFSFNGIDYIESEQGRSRALSQIRNVLNPGDYFIFSTHNSLYRGKKKVQVYEKDGRFRIVEGTFGHLKTYYISPFAQRRQLGLHPVSKTAS